MIEAWLRMKTFCKLTFPALILACSAGCITVGVDPKREIRVRTESSEDVSFQTVSHIEEPVVSIKRIIGDDNLIISVEARQQIENKIIEVFHHETWEIEDGKALSIGLFPGYGRLIYNPYSYSKAGGWVMLPVASAVSNIFTLMIPTLGGLFYVPFVNETNVYESQMALIGCDRFPTGKTVGERKTTDYVEKQLNDVGPDWVSASTMSQGIDATIVATVDIPSMWFRESVVMKPQRYGQSIVSCGKLPLPFTPPPTTTGTVSIFFIDESGVYGQKLNPHQGMVSPFEL